MAQLVKNLPAMLRDLGSIPGLGKCPGEGKGYLLQHSGLENSMDYGVAKSWIRVTYFHFHFQKKENKFSLKKKKKKPAKSKVR